MIHFLVKLWALWAKTQRLLVGNKTKFSDWYILLVGAFLLSFLLIAGAFTIFPVIENKAKTLKWAEWTGFGRDTTRSESVETKTEIGKKTVTTHFQSGKTLWDVLELAGTLAIPVLLTILGIWFQQREQEQSEKQAQTEKDIANENLRDEALQAYIDRLSELLLDRNLIHSDDNDPVRDVARTRTLTILRRLGDDRERKARVLHFLYDAGLLEIKPVPLINLKDADFRASDLSSANLSDAYLRGANLSRANLSSADLSGTDLIGADLSFTNLIGAVINSSTKFDNKWCLVWEIVNQKDKLSGLSYADLSHAYLRGTNLSDANLSHADLSHADLSHADLSDAVLSFADLSDVDLSFADLSDADLGKANLSGANLGKANLSGANLSGANLSGANLSGANLSGANLSNAAKA